MLKELTIRDFAIIEELYLDLSPGFTALTGETGAGKSIIIDAVEMVLGARADRTIVRAERERALVEGIFQLRPEHQARLRPLLEKEGLEGDAPDLLFLSREIRSEGRSICRVNGRMVTMALLREVAQGLVDIHGQSEHLSLLQVQEQLHLLDRYGNLTDLKARVADQVGRVRAVRQERISLEKDEAALAQRMDLLQYQIKEISAADLQPGEVKALTEERVRLTNAEQLAGLLVEGLQALDEGGEQSSAAVDLLSEATRALEKLARIDAALDPHLKEAEELTYRLQELAQVLRGYQEKIEYNPSRLAEVEDRLDLIRRLGRKYGTTIPDMLAYHQKAVQELEAITHSEERILELRAEEERLLAELGTLVAELSLRRRETARQLSQGIERELEDLRMEGARFGVSFQLRGDPQGVPVPPTVLNSVSPVSSQTTEDSQNSGLETLDLGPGQRVAFDGSGIDRVEFLISPNPGEPLKSLAKIASGGETARLMLALKAVLTRADETPTLIFDEIDQGIGGRVGATVGEKLWELTADREGELAHQVLCVTHLPQLAGFGDVHLKVEKEVVGERTITHIASLQGSAQVEELAQMLGASGDSAYRSAEEILELVEDRKTQVGRK